MKAIVFNEYGPPEVLKLVEMVSPLPGEDEILLKVHSTVVNSADIRLRKADPFAVRFMLGLFKPRIKVLGGVFSGTVVAIGSNVQNIKPGAEIFGSTDMKFGAYAEYLCINEKSAWAIKPACITHMEASVLPFGGTTANFFLQKAGVKSDQKILVYGASGAVGTAAVQLACYLGAEVTAVCSKSNFELVKSLGAYRCIDYHTENSFTHTHQYDVIFDTVNKLKVRDSLKALKKGGVLILSAAGIKEMIEGARIAVGKEYRVLLGVTKQTNKDIAFLGKLAEEGSFKPVIDRVYQLDEITEAHRYVELGHKKGNVVIRV